jgi:hypothetical protein
MRADPSHLALAQLEQIGYGGHGHLGQSWHHTASSRGKYQGS